MVQFTCDYCGNTFLQYPSNRVDPPYFCNRTCYHAWRSMSPAITVCEVCKNPFEHKSCQPRRFCGRACGGIWASANRLKERAPVWKGGMPERTCEMCHKVYQQVAYSNQNRPQQHFFCSHSCHGAWTSIHRSGSNNPLWKGDCKKYRYYGPNWKQQKRLARKRDAYKCRACGKTTKQNGRALDVHHLKPFRDFNYIPDANDNYLEANDLTNLVSVCHWCHRLVEVGAVPIQLYLL